MIIIVMNVREMEMSNKLFKYCNRVTSKPLFPAVVVFTLSFLVSGALLQMSSIGDNGIACNEKTNAEKNLCTKLNVIFLILAPTIPVMAGITTYLIGKKYYTKERFTTYFSNPPFSTGDDW